MSCPTYQSTLICAAYRNEVSRLQQEGNIFLASRIWRYYLEEMDICDDLLTMQTRILWC